jgi:hypothetical protein
MASWTSVRCNLIRRVRPVSVHLPKSNGSFSSMSGIWFSRLQWKLLNLYVRDFYILENCADSTRHVTFLGGMGTTRPLKSGETHSGGGLLIANHLFQSLWWANEKYWAAVRSYLLHSFVQVHKRCCSFTELCWAKIIFPSQAGISWLVFIQFYYVVAYTEHRWRCSKHEPASSLLRQTLYLLENCAHSGAQTYGDLNLGILEALPCYEVPRHDGDNPSAGNLKTWKGLEGSTSLVKHSLIFYLFNYFLVPFCSRLCILPLSTVNYSLVFLKL